MLKLIKAGGGKFSPEEVTELTLEEVKAMIVEQIPNAFDKKGAKKVAAKKSLEPKLKVVKKAKATKKTAKKIETVKKAATKKTITNAALKKKPSSKKK